MNTKINIDAIVFMEPGYIGISSVIRDEHGAFDRARIKRLAGLYQPRKAEAIGLKQTFSSVKDL